MNPLLMIASFPLRAKLVLGLAAGAIVAVVLAAFAINQYNLAAQPTTDLVINTLSQERATMLNAILSQESGLAEQIASNPLTVSYFTTLIKDPANGAARQKIEQSFQQVLNVDPAVRQMRFVGLDGTVLVASPQSTKGSDTNEDYYKVLRQRPVTNGTGATYISRSGTPGNQSFDFVAVATVGGQPSGFVVASVDPSGSAGAATSIYDILRVVSPESGIVIFYLVDAKGNIISPVIQPMSGPQSAVVAAKLASQPFNLPGEYVSPVSGATVIGLTTPIDRLGMTLIAETRLIQLAGSNETGKFVAQILGLLLISLLVLLLIWLYWEITVISPAQRVLAAAVSSAQGRPQGKVRPLRQRDELGNLDAAFTALDRQLRLDITALETRVAARTRDIEATRDIGQISASIRDVNTLMNKVIELIRTRFENIYHAQIFLLDAKREYAVLRASTGEAGQKLMERGHRLAVGGQSVIGQVTQTAQPVIALDTSTSAIHKVNELLPETRAELALPLRSGDDIIGALDLQSKRPDAFTEADIRLFQSIAEQLTVAISNARLFEELAVRVREIEDLNRQLIGDAWQDYVNVRRRALPSVSVGDPDRNAWSELQRQAAESGQVAERIGSDVVTLAVPISLRGQVLGTIEWDMPRLAYNENTRQLAEELASRLAITADNARLFEQSQRLAERERLVNEVASKLTQQADVSQILRIAVKEVGLALRVPQTSIRLSANRDVNPSPDPTVGLS